MFGREQLGRARRVPTPATVFTVANEARVLIGRLALIELDPAVLVRALEPFPAPVRTLDALHLASIEFLRSRRQTVELLSYDERLIAAARALRIPLSKA